jgi:hypothetical protein
MDHLCVWLLVCLLGVAVTAHSAGPSTGLADSAALRATVFGTPSQDLAPVPTHVPLTELNLLMPWAQPLPKLFWFDRKLRVWFSAQRKAAPLVIVIGGTGADGNTSKLSLLRGALYGAGYHVLTMPSPTFPGFIASTSSTGVAGDLIQDSRDLYRAMQLIIAQLPRRVKITDISVVGYSLGGANAAVVKSIDATEGHLKIHRALMINPPVSLFSTMARLDQLYISNIGPDDASLEELYRKLYARLANIYRESDRASLDTHDLLESAAAILKTDAEFSAAIALKFRLDLLNVFFMGDLYARTGVVVDADYPPHPGESLADIHRSLRQKPFAEYLSQVFIPYYLARQPESTSASLMAGNKLAVIGEALRHSPDYFVQTNSDDLILDRAELQWLKDTMVSRIAVYDNGGHLGNLGGRKQIADMLDMLAGRWTGQAR